MSQFIDKINEAIEYFKHEKVFQKLFHLFIKKYKSLGRIGGKVTLDDLTVREKEVLSSFFRKDFTNETTVSISFSQFKKALDATKFTGIDLKDLLDGYAGQILISQAEEKEQYERQKAKFFEEFARRYTNLYAQGWIKHIQEKGSGVRGVHLAYDKDPDRLKQQLSNVLQAISKLPLLSHGDFIREKEYVRLPVFAYQITKNPHGFDLDSDQGRLLISALQWVRTVVDQGYEIVNSLTIEDVNDLLQYFGIIRDDILNFVTCTGIIGYDKDGKPSPFWLEAYKEQIVLNVPLRELVKLYSFLPGSVVQSSRTNVVFVVENSGVFSAIIDQLQLKESAPIICTHGQFKLATLILLDHLVQNRTKIYYSGDYDPEGLQMAQRLKVRYPEHVQLWRFEIEEYLEAISNIELSDARLKKLNTITLDELLPLKKQIAMKRKAGYQEKLIPKLMEDIQKIMCNE
ncbi:TIGR02679 family protein [Tepidibacillus fermentans]|uniref:Uncharacterized protein (TIGR02679 family) n=1 Tax=Tepidibacillus fermentans TaxID=1281767 RepID=A0A4V2UT74_9BACI|nr:TIGR02679 family protein [Tepidibacillus fermentans]TCS84479.1 uncharacterized protein (TIGR02679 family) [Tepidibacillus fermentans]